MNVMNSTKLHPVKSNQDIHKARSFLQKNEIKIENENRKACL